MRFIGAFACSGSWNLTRVVIHAQVVGIGEGAFARVRGLQAFEVAEANPAFASVEGVLFNKDRTTLLQFPAGRGGDYAIPAGVTALAPGAFLGCTALRRVEMPDSVTNMGAGAFSGCEALDVVSLSSRLTAIAPEAFATCWSLRRIVLPDSVSEVGQRAFYQAGLEMVVLGRGVTWVGEGAFDNRFTVCRGGGGSVCYGPRDYYGARVDLFFLGRAPQAVRPFGDRPVLWGRDFSEPPRVFHLAEAAGWGPEFEGVPTDLWRGIHLLRGADGLTLIWSAGVLQASPALGEGSVGAGWSDMPATAPLHLVHPTAATTFYRLRDP